MGNRVGVIFHNNWKDFSPLLYSHYGANRVPFQVQFYLKEYLDTYQKDTNNGHLYDCSHMMVGFLQSIDKDKDIRVESLSDNNILYLQDSHEYPNCFEGGCWIVDVSTENFGNTVSGNYWFLQNDNIVTDELESEYQ